jgi:hypothetical protein
LDLFIKINNVRTEWEIIDLKMINNYEKRRNKLGLSCAKLRSSWG